jgi:hypothetical protein
MALPSGTIKFSDFNTALGRTGPVKLSDLYSFAPGVPTAGTISANGLRGKSRYQNTAGFVASMRTLTVANGIMNPNFWTNPFNPTPIYSSLGGPWMSSVHTVTQDGGYAFGTIYQPWGPNLVQGQTLFDKTSNVVAAATTTLHASTYNLTHGNCAHLFNYLRSDGTFGWTASLRSLGSLAGNVHEVSSCSNTALFAGGFTGGNLMSIYLGDVLLATPTVISTSLINAPLYVIGITEDGQGQGGLFSFALRCNGGRIRLAPQRNGGGGFVLGVQNSTPANVLHYGGSLTANFAPFNVCNNKKNIYLTNINSSGVPNQTNSLRIFAAGDLFIHTLKTHTDGSTFVSFTGTTSTTGLSFVTGSSQAVVHNQMSAGTLSYVAKFDVNMNLLWCSYFKALDAALNAVTMYSAIMDLTPAGNVVVGCTQSLTRVHQIGSSNLPHISTINTAEGYLEAMMFVRLSGSDGALQDSTTLGTSNLITHAVTSITCRETEGEFLVSFMNNNSAQVDPYNYTHNSTTDIPFLSSANVILLEGTGAHTYENHFIVSFDASMGLKWTTKLVHEYGKLFNANYVHGSYDSRGDRLLYGGGISSYFAGGVYWKDPTSATKNYVFTENRYNACDVSLVNVDASTGAF